jgi:hypothetical protein
MKFNFAFIFSFLFVVNLSAQEEDAKRDSIEIAASFFDLDFTQSEIDQMRYTLLTNKYNYSALHKESLDMNTPPALVFFPRVNNQFIDKNLNDINWNTTDVV